MAQIQDRKKKFYSSTQSAKDEECASEYLESAGDSLIKDLARKQKCTSTTLEEQLDLTQNFAKSFELKPYGQEGISTLQEFQSRIIDDRAEDLEEADPTADKTEDVEELKRRTGLSRHELQLGLSEKPNSKASKLYKFALSNKRRRTEKDDLATKLISHPINYLKEIEEEYFGHLRTGKTKEDSAGNDLVGIVNESGNEEAIPNKKKKKKRRRKRKKKTGSVEPGDLNIVKEVECEPSGGAEDDSEDGDGPGTSYRPSLWDVKDMRKLCKPARTQGCKPGGLYRIKDGQIVKLNQEERTNE